MVLACATHWYTAMAYFAPVLGVGGWLGWVPLREKLRSHPSVQADDVSVRLGALGEWSFDVDVAVQSVHDAFDLGSDTDATVYAGTGR